MVYFKRFLHAKAYRTYAIIISTAVAIPMLSAGSIRMGSEDAQGRQVSEAIREDEMADGEAGAETLTLDIVSLEAVGIESLSFMSRNADAVDKDGGNGDISKDSEMRGSGVVSEDSEMSGSSDVIGSGDAAENSEITENASLAEGDTNECSISAQGITVTEKDYEALQRIVEAEAGNQDDIGRILVANVVLNRARSDKFPDGITENIFKRNGDLYQFAPIGNGSYYTVTVSEKTKECVDRALAGEDYSDGALFFTRKTSPDSWFNTSLTLLFIHGAHYFYR